MNYALQNIRFDDLILRDLGEDYYFVQFELEHDGKAYDDAIEFDLIWGFAKRTGRPEGKYFDAVRAGIKGFGPKHSKMFKVFMEDGFEFEPLLRGTLDEIFAEKGFGWLRLKNREEEMAKMDPKNREAIESLWASFQEIRPSVRHYNLQQAKLEKNLLDFLSRETMRLFPEILESDSAYIKELNEIMYGWDAQGLVEKLVNLAIKAQDAKEQSESGDEVFL